MSELSDYDEALISIIAEEFKAHFLGIFIEASQSISVCFVHTYTEGFPRGMLLQEFNSINDIDVSAGYLIREYGQAPESKTYIKDGFKPFSEAFADRIIAEQCRLLDESQNQGLMPLGKILFASSTPNGVSPFGTMISGMKSTPRRGKTHKQVFELLLTLPRIELERIYLGIMGCFVSNSSSDAEVAMYIVSAVGHKEALKLYEGIVNNEF